MEWKKEIIVNVVWGGTELRPANETELHKLDSFDGRKIKGFFGQNRMTLVIIDWTQIETAMQVIKVILEARVVIPNLHQIVEV